METMPPLEGVLETALYVGDLDRSIAFYERVFGFQTMLHDERMAGLRVPGRQVLLLFRRGGSTEPSPTPNGTIPPHDGRGTLHLAFAIGAAQVDAWRRWFRAQNVAIDSEVHNERGGHSIYVRDPDGHSVEVATRALWPWDE